jgi:hypothetical protein
MAATMSRRTSDDGDAQPIRTLDVYCKLDAKSKAHVMS